MFKTKQHRLNTLESLVSKWQDRLFRFAYMRIGIREDAEDIVQDVFIAYFNATQQGAEIKDADRYLLRSVANACISYYRRHPHTELSIEEAETVAVDEHDRDIQEEYIRIKKLLQNLPLQQAETLRMKCFDGLTFAQIAEIEDIPEATAKSRYRYALNNLRQLLSNNKI